MKAFPHGVYPTMITPYKDGRIDFDAVRKLVDFYVEKGCTGVFAVCQSSEMAFLSLSERVELAKAVVNAANGRIAVVASGHCGNSLEEQAEETKRIAETGIDAFVLVSNRLDLHNDGDDVWLSNAEKLLTMIPEELPLGIYECPMPYKRLLTEKDLAFCKDTGRFRFIKDTCCDPDLLSQRLEQLKDSQVLLFNATGQTLLHSLRHGAAGYSGIMANFHPHLLSWLCANYDRRPEVAEPLADALSMMAFTENPAYPNTAKYYLNKVGISMDLYSRSSDPKRLTPYQMLCVDQMFRMDKELAAWLGEKGEQV